VGDNYIELDLRYYMLALLPLLILMNLIRNLKFLAPFSMIANVLIGTGMGITFYYILQDVPSISERPVFSSIERLPLFFGTAIFALEGVGVVSLNTFGPFPIDFKPLKLKAKLCK
jgi:proton-coupled amino acid transporter